MEPFSYEHRFHEALQKAFAARSPAVRTAYFELASYYREKLGGSIQMQPPVALIKKIARLQLHEQREQDAA